MTAIQPSPLFTTNARWPDGSITTPFRHDPALTRRTSRRPDMMQKRNAPATDALIRKRYLEGFGIGT